MKVGIIGGGAIAQFVLENLNKKHDSPQTVTSVYVRDVKKYAFLATRYGIELYDCLQSFLQSNVEIVVEAAGIDATKETVPTVVRHKDVIMISIGALADEVFYTKVCTTAQKYNHTIYLPSGGIGGLDLLQSANALGEVQAVSLTTKKPAHALTTENIVEPKTIFSGLAKEAIRLFPENMNVSIVLALAGIGIERTKVAIVADPTIHKNVHMIEIEGSFGTATFTMENNPLASNPKTSELAALSVIRTLHNRRSAIQIGG